MDVLKAPQQRDEGRRQQAAAHAVVIVMVTATERGEKKHPNKIFKMKWGLTASVQFCQAVISTPHVPSTGTCTDCCMLFKGGRTK